MKFIELFLEKFRPKDQKKIVSFGRGKDILDFDKPKIELIGERAFKEIENLFLWKDSFKREDVVKILKEAFISGKFFLPEVEAKEEAERAPRKFDRQTTGSLSSETIEFDVHTRVS